MEQRYFNLWDNAEDIIKDFSGTRWSYEENKKDPIVLLDEEVLFASYVDRDYSGDAFVLFRRDGKFYEASGGHCSCSGLEGQWSPEETTTEALKARRADYDHKDRTDLIGSDHGPEAQAAARLCAEVLD